MKILGIDPGYERLGIAVLEKNNSGKEVVLYSECFKTSAKDPFADRLLQVGQRINEVIHKHQPNIMAIETLFMTTNQKTAMRVAEARGVVVYEGTRGGLEIFEATPLQIKIATTGYGKADKAQVMKMVKMLVEIDQNKASDDELDAIAVGLTAFAHMRF